MYDLKIILRLKLTFHIKNLDLKNLDLRFEISIYA